MKQGLLKNGLTALLVVAAAGFAGCGDNSGSHSEGSHDSASHGAANNQTQSERAEATLDGTTSDTTVTGTVRFEHQGNGQVRMTLDITVDKMANKSVAVHIHEHADCGDHGNHAGGHWNPTGENHGKWGEGSYHSGDFGNINLDGSGKGTLELTSDRWSIGGDEKKNVVNKTVVVHSGVDDLKSQPSGNSGSRIGCGVIKGS
ncbi:superoxide dismutase family protein [Aridibaculum aurantiacum]|uniref:superoxide dismutase family protein n=1 Tax=Aridibaculum aurantiacum TaxID=2810307 RepID=UPI001A95F201|nr:superoxide dismutase family protein [Aridibaculum aurantiacum]